MSSPGIRPRNNQPAAGGGKKGPQQALRVLSTDGAARAAAPSIAMPRAKTELTELLAGDHLLCVRRRASATATRPGMPASARDPQRRESPADILADQSADADLGQVIDAWPGLPRNVRTAILAMIRETPAGGRKRLQQNVVVVWPSRLYAGGPNKVRA